MKNLSSLLERFAKSLGKDVIQREVVLTCIESITNIRLKEKEIAIKEGTLFITSTPLKNNEIRLKEEKIINSLKGERNLFIKKILYK